jgi:hypothetical protein
MRGAEGTTPLATAAPAAARRRGPANADVAAVLEEVAALLAAQGANPFRVAAYRRGAAAVRAARRPVAELIAPDLGPAPGALRGVGPRLARAVAEIVATGRLALLDRLRGEAGADVLFASVPGLGPVLARRAHEALGVETLEQLEAAAHDGRLRRVPGFGARRVQAVADTMATRLGRRWPGRTAGPVEPDDAGATPPVGELLDVDRQYREDAAAGRLRRIAPRRFNPDGRAWLPILHTERGPHHFTALYSNTALAHRLGRTEDWVVVYLDDGAGPQWTVVTESRGALAGRRVVRGREEECERHYAGPPSGALARGQRAGDKGPGY